MKTLLRLIKNSFFILLVISQSCKKEQVPTLVTSEITDIKGTCAISGGMITDEGESKVLSRGVCWGTNNAPTILDSITVDGTGTGSFISNIFRLNVETKYFVRAYATNDAGTGYGSVKSFSTHAFTTVDLFAGKWSVVSYKITIYIDNVFISEQTTYVEHGDMYYEFFANSTGNLYRDSYLNYFEWEVDGNLLIITLSGEDPMEAEFSHNEDTMTLFQAQEYTSNGKVTKLLMDLTLNRD
jgi:hypothetical protein